MKNSYLLHNQTKHKTNMNQWNIQLDTAHAQLTTH